VTAPAPKPAERPVRLREAPSGLPDSLLGIAAMVLLGGYFAVAAVAGVLICARRRVQMRILVVGFGVLAGVGAASSTNADTAGFAATVSIASALVVVACLVVRLDSVGAGVLTRVSRLVPASAPGHRSLISRVRDWRAARQPG
jgi:hypothetical protein